MPDYGPLVIKYATRYRIPLPLANHLIGQESGGRAGVRSPVGATGLTQVMPATFVGMYGGTEAQAIERLKHPEVALDAGFRYLRRQMDAFKSWRLALAAYNAGPSRARDGSWLKIPETRNYVNALLQYAVGGRAEPAGGSQGSIPGIPASSPPPLDLSGQALAGLQDVASGERYDAVAALGRTAQAAAAAPSPAAVAEQVDAPASSPGVRRRGGSSPPGGMKGKINELFYDPLGGIKYGEQIGAIGNHTDHVHVALSTKGAQLAAIRKARALGLSVRQERNSDVTQVHVEGSFHYRNYPSGGSLRMAADVSSDDPAKMAAFYRWVAQRYG